MAEKLPLCCKIRSTNLLLGCGHIGDIVNKHHFLKYLLFIVTKIKQTEYKLMRKDCNIKMVNLMPLEGIRHCHALTLYHTKYKCKEEIMQSANV